MGEVGHTVVASSDGLASWAHEGGRDAAHQGLWMPSETINHVLGQPVRDVFGQKCQECSWAEVSGMSLFGPSNRVLTFSMISLSRAFSFS